jgi:hypothetical protein
MGFDGSDSEGSNSVDEGLGSAFGRVVSALKSNADSDTIKEGTKILEEGFSSVARSMGLTRASSEAIKKTLADAYADAASIGATFQDAVDAQGAITKTTGRNLIMSSDFLKDIKMAAEVSGIAIGDLTEGFINAGYNMNNIADEMEKVFDVSRSLGVNLQAVTASVSANMGKLDEHNFKGGVEGLAKMAATSASLRVDMSEIFRAVDKAFDPEGAIDMAAAFQRLGVTQSDLLDPLRLMNMSMNDPEEMMKSLADMGKSLTELDEKGNIRIAPGEIRRMKQLADAAGMSSSEFAKMSKAAAEMDIKMQKISFPDFATDEQKTLIANISQMKDGKIQMNVDGEMKDVNEVLKKFQGDQAGLEKFLKESQPKSTEDLLRESNTIAKEQTNAINALRGKTALAIGSAKVTEDIMMAQKDAVVGFANVLGKTLDVKTIRDGFETNVGGITTALSRLATGEGSMEEVTKAFSDSVSSVTKGLGEAKDNLIKYSKEEKEKIMSGDNIMSKAIITLIEKLGTAALDSEGVKINSTPVVNSTPTFGTESIASIQPSTSTISDKRIDEISKNMGMKTEDMMKLIKLNTKTDVSGKIELQLNVNAPAGVGTKQLEIALKDGAIQQQVMKMIAASNGDIFSGIKK